MNISVVVPVYNEIENVDPLHAALNAALSRLGHSYELLLIDDGSTDGSTERLRQIAARDPHVKLIEFRRNYGQTAALDAGLRHASGDVIVTLDADLQNDPGDIPLLLAKLDEGYDLVQGWRRDRQDPFWHRRLPSLLANRLIAKVTGFSVHDLGCTLKAIRREIADELRLYGEMHRFIPILAHWQGARVAEVVTRHHPRRAGTSKYGLSRTLRVLLDLITVKYLTAHLQSPMKLFGTVGAGSLAAGLCSAFATVLMKVIGFDMTGNPLLLSTVFFLLAGMQFFVLGMLGELSVRIYYEAQHTRPYAIRRLTNFDTVKMKSAA